MSYRVAIVDDSGTDTAYISSLVSDWAKSRDTSITVSTFSSAETFLFDNAGNCTFDILMLDIEMGGMNGVELARKLRADGGDMQLVFITGYPDFIADGYEVSALHYLMKPVNTEKLYSVLDRALSNLSKQDQQAILLLLDGESVRIRLNEIHYLEAGDHCVRVVTAQETYVPKVSLYEMESKLSGDFVRLHRGCIVNLRYVKKITRTDVTLDSGITLPVSRRMYTEVNRAMMKYLTGGEQI